MTGDPGRRLPTGAFSSPAGAPARALASILQADEWRMRVLGLVRGLGLPDCWVGAGFVRNAVWDWLDGRGTGKPSGDVDVIWRDPLRADRGEDARLEERLFSLDASVPWSVKNQSRMHARNGDAPYESCEEALRHWPETATAVAVRAGADASIEILAPFGLEDLFGGVIRPTPRFAHDKRHVFDARWREKGWLREWPFLRVVAD